MSEHEDLAGVIDERAKDLLGALERLERRVTVHDDRKASDRFINPHEVGAEHDALRRKVPHVPDFAGLMFRVMRRTFEGRVRRIPTKAVVEEGEDDQGLYALVTCPCGSQPVARRIMSCCPGCSRWYVSARAGVFVIYGDGMKPPPIPVESAAQRGELREDGR